MSAETASLRSLQKEHSLILLTPVEFAELTKSHSLNLPDRHREHFGKVLRRKESWPALMGDGGGNLVRGTVQGESITIEKDARQLDATHRARRVHLIQAWVKPKALATILQKAAEIGVDKICLVDTEFSQPHSEKAQRLEAILENACMQAYNPLKPKLLFAGKLAEIAMPKDSSFFGDLETRLSLRAVPLHKDTSTFINGPEGGFSPGETALLREMATGVLLSENVLRSDSAAIIALGFLRFPE